MRHVLRCALFMVALLLSPALLAAQSATQSAVPSASPSATLRQMLDSASRNNQLPGSLLSYQANVETEIAIVLRREEGTEAVAGMEQVASRLTWNRTGAYEQRVMGYRAQQQGANISALSFFQTGWINPVLYGNRLRIRPRPAGRRSAVLPESMRRRADARRAADTLPAVHPLAADRDRYYRYSGGDTVAVIRTGTRVIPVMHVRVEPRSDITESVVLFDGGMELDLSRGALVRLRGYFRSTRSTRSLLSRTLTDAVAYVEYENGERDGQYWLPATQRIELQANIPTLGDSRAVIRIVSRVRDLVVNDTVLDARTLVMTEPVADSLRAVAPLRLTFAPADSLSRFSRWRSQLGALTEGLHSDDFQDIAPDRWRTRGAPRFDLSAPRAADVVHFNRVEGFFTGLGGKWSLRDAAPGVVVRANAGYAWAERTVRGRVSVERTRGAWTLEARGGRSMDITNDFRVPFDSGNSAGAIFGSIDPYDYVSRSVAALAVTRTIGDRRWLARADVGYADDRWRPSQYTRGPLGGDAFRENRGVAEGGYVRSIATLEWHPDRSAEFVKPGLGARLFYERGDGPTSGAVRYQRAEVRVNGRRVLGPLVLIARGDAGLVTGARIPPQQIFELGKYQNLPSYQDKQFAGSRAAVLRASAIYTSPFLRNPLRVGRTLWLPAINPGVSVGVQSGWADAPTAAARSAINALDQQFDPQRLALWAPVAVPTGRVRASVTAGFRFFGNALFAGATRAVDQAAPWSTLVGFGQAW